MRTNPTHTIPSLSGTLAKRSTPTHGGQDSAAKMNDKMTGKINNETLTSYIKHLADSANFIGVTSNKHCSGLKGKCFKMPNVSYT